jgi:large subunit ribosomal protein L23
MGLFGKKEDAVVEETTAKTVKAPVPQKGVFDHTAVIVRPYITEKAAILMERNIYTFEVSKGATKHQIRDAIKTLYNVTPLTIRIVNKVPRHFMSRMRGRDMMEHGLRKAYVYLKKDDRLNLV